jgi:ankyrin repeat protein
MDSFDVALKALLHVQTLQSTIDVLHATTDSEETKSNSLVLAASIGLEGIVVKLLKEELELVDARSSDGTTALIAAACSGHSSVVQLLLDRGADVNAYDIHGSTALLAASSGLDTLGCLVLLLCHGADVNRTDNHGDSALHVASCNRQEGVVQLVLDYGADVNARNKFGYTALTLAAHQGSAALVKLLLHHGAYVHSHTEVLGAARSSDRGGRVSTLHIACEGGYQQIVEMALAYGANPVSRSAAGLSALHFAVLWSC